MRSICIPWHAHQTWLCIPTRVVVAFAAFPLACGLVTQRWESLLLGLLGVAVLAVAACAHDAVQLLAIPRPLWPERPTVVPGTSQLRAVEAPPERQLVAALAGLAVYAGLAAGTQAVNHALAQAHVTVLGVAELAQACTALVLLQLVPAYPFDGAFLLEAVLRRTSAAPFAAELVSLSAYPLAIAIGLSGVFGQPVLIALGAWIWLATTERRESVWAVAPGLSRLAADLRRSAAAPWRSRTSVEAFEKSGSLLSWSRTVIIQL